MTETPQQAYISKVHLKGYKSIRDLEIDFKPGLNIIIGPNGSGKTNFLEFVKAPLQFSFNNFAQERYFAEVQYVDKDCSILNFSLNGDFRISKNKRQAFILNQVLKWNNRIFIDREIIFEQGNEEPIYQIKSAVSSGSLEYSVPKSVTFNNPLHEVLNKGIELEVLNGIQSYDENGEHIGEPYSMLFVKEAKKLDGIAELIIQSFDSEDKNKVRGIKDKLKIPLNFINQLSKFTPIKGINFDFDIIREYNNKDIDNLFFKFKVNTKWLYWNQLSDGTKRLFYIFTIIYFDNGGIVLLEEPELGIHPDQLHKLMDFLIEQSKEKQIIITTHSPEVLNAIHPDELDRIIVTRYDADKGTIMHKLTPEQAKEMGERVKEGDMFLSDRWVHLNLEDEIFNATKLNEK